MKILSLNIRGLGYEDKNKFNWFKKVCFQNKPNIIALQETKAEKISEQWIERIWGNCDYRYAFKKSNGNSGGILTIWDPNIFIANRVVERESYIAIKGHWQDLGTELILINVYARFAYERKNTEFCERKAKIFNDFIKDSSLLDLPLGGRTYTRISDNGTKFSKLDRFLVSKNFIQQWPNANVLVLDKKHTDHFPLFLKDGDIDFGPKPVKVFDEWLNQKNSHDVINAAWKSSVNSNKPDVIF
ncbi:uncharacterized protein [Rutidosis leptorrhynchoides]|uniref:uncharacterized protein n=1 Tax=Rutidosis leptorrhynchoides TaxID=125765 RepID=UPI003A999CF6